MQFSKYHGLGNDFIIVDLRRAIANRDADAEQVQDPDVVRQLCDRRRGVGADGVLALLPARPGVDADVRMRVLNADGSEAEMCGNGLRCVVKHLYERDLELRRRADAAASARAAPTLVIDTDAGPLTCRVHHSPSLRHGGEPEPADVPHVVEVTVDMGAPALTRGRIPMTGPADERCVEQPLALPAALTKGLPGSLTFTAVAMGNPHAIAFVDAPAPADDEQRRASGTKAAPPHDLLQLATRIGPAVETHDSFPARTNVELARLRPTGPGEALAIDLVVWERGCGITNACGTGACATAVAACLTGRAPVEAELEVHLPGGTLSITVARDLERVFMRGPATHVYDGTLALAPTPSAPDA